jgi:hypothetical protein
VVQKDYLSQIPIAPPALRLSQCLKRLAGFPLPTGRRTMIVVASAWEPVTKFPMATGRALLMGLKSSP